VSLKKTLYREKKTLKYGKFEKLVIILSIEKKIPTFYRHDNLERLPFFGQREEK
jgi:hypothetical protein